MYGLVERGHGGFVGDVADDVHTGLETGYRLPVEEGQFEAGLGQHLGNAQPDALSGTCDDGDGSSHGRQAVMPLESPRQRVRGRGAVR